MNSRETNKCPVCQKSELGYFDICPFCEWQNDHYQLFHPDKSGGANQMSLNEARIAYEKGDPVL